MTNKERRIVSDLLARHDALLGVLKLSYVSIIALADPQSATPVSVEAASDRQLTAEKATKNLREGIPFQRDELAKVRAQLGLVR